MLEIHLGSPKSVKIFKDVFIKFTATGVLTPKIAWSWTAFWGSFCYFFYRKLYKIGIKIIMIAILAFVFKCLDLFLIDYTDVFNKYSSAVVVSLYVYLIAKAKFYYIDKFLNDLVKSGYGYKSIDEVKLSLKKLGGVNKRSLILIPVYIFLLAYYLMLYGWIQDIRYHHKKNTICSLLYVG